LASSDKIFCSVCQVSGMSASMLLTLHLRPSVSSWTEVKLTVLSGCCVRWQHCSPCDRSSLFGCYSQIATFHLNLFATHEPESPITTRHRFCQRWSYTHLSYPPHLRHCQRRTWRYGNSTVGCTVFSVSQQSLLYRIKKSIKTIELAAFVQFKMLPRVPILANTDNLYNQIVTLIAIFFFVSAVLCIHALYIQRVLLIPCCILPYHKRTRQ